MATPDSLDFSVLSESASVSPCSGYIFLDCIHVKVRDAGAVRSKLVYLATSMASAPEKACIRYDTPLRGAPLAGAGAVDCYFLDITGNYSLISMMYDRMAIFVRSATLFASNFSITVLIMS